MADTKELTQILTSSKDQLLNGWMQELTRVLVTGEKRIHEATLRSEATELIALIGAASQKDADFQVDAPAWRPVLEFLTKLSASRALLGMDSASTASFVFGLKRPLFQAIRDSSKNDADRLARLNWVATELVDQLGLRTVAAYQTAREKEIARQKEDMLELSTPVVKLWDGILALPMIGTLDSQRTQVMMESLLGRIVESGAQITILDITGVPTVDTLVAQNLIKTITAIRLMGGDCIISGLRPQIAQTIVHLGVDLGGITTKATLADALALALKRTGQAVVKNGTAS